MIDDSDCSDLSNDGVADTTDEAHGLIQAEGAPDEVCDVVGESCSIHLTHPTSATLAGVSLPKLLQTLLFTALLHFCSAGWSEAWSHRPAGAYRACAC